MEDIERRALLGDKQAQEECTRQGIVLPCPFCGGPAALKTQKVQYGLSGTIISCKKCMVQLYSPDQRAVSTSIGVRNRPIEKHKEIGIGRWNTRPAPPIGRCGECAERNKGDSDICFYGSDNDFCSGFKPEGGGKCG
ncbi:Lar family restriction alleviation protein [Candidatus Allofournierella merdipullorum]|uniref:Lar family restriction alleviation protein n=1 Tax=Candidatus Allofournierella merdipullorum TaxID=2838595 RepID=UPI002A85AFB7|nr:Lar family restriction alleviation protein [Candidatus Fournierella merdipullorum]